MFRPPISPLPTTTLRLARSARPRPRLAPLQRHARLSSEWAAAKAKVDEQVDAWRQKHGDKKTLLIVYHSRTGGAAGMAALALQGALEGLNERSIDVPSLQATWDTTEFRYPSLLETHSGNPNPDSGKSTPAPHAPDISKIDEGVISGPGVADPRSTPHSASPSCSHSDERSEALSASTSDSASTASSASSASSGSASRSGALPSSKAPSSSDSADAESSSSDSAAAESSDDISIRVLPAPLAGPVDLLTSSGYLFICPENLAALSGPMKDFFDRCFYPVLNRLNGRPYQALICAGSDGAGAAKQLERIATGWRLKKVEETVICNVRAQSEERVYAAKEIGEEDREKCKEAGMRMAVGLSVGMF